MRSTSRKTLSGFSYSAASNPPSHSCIASKGRSARCRIPSVSDRVPLQRSWIISSAQENIPYQMSRLLEPPPFCFEFRRVFLGVMNAFTLDVRSVFLPKFRLRISPLGPTAVDTVGLASRSPSVLAVMVMSLGIIFNRMTLSHRLALVC